MTGRDLLNAIGCMKNIDDEFEFKEFIEVEQETKNMIDKLANDCGQTSMEYLKQLMYEVTEIVPTKEEKKLWKQNLYNACICLATERDDCGAHKSDSLETLLETFFFWADTYNDGYFTEMDDADTDRYCAWLVQEHRRFN